jgi:signal transduction histidine kinase
MAVKRPQQRDLFAAAVGFGVIFLLVTGASAFSYLAGNRAQADVREIVTESERTATLASRVGGELSRVHADTLEALTEPKEAVGPIAHRIDRVNGELDEILRELEPRLSRDQVPQWQQITPTISMLRADFAAALADIEAGKRADAENALDRDAMLSAWLFDALEDLCAVSRANAQRAENRLEERIASATRLQTLSLAVLVACTLLIGAAVVRVQRRQRTELSAYVDRIERANSDLEAFAGRIAHDLKNLLTPVIVAPRTLQRSATEPELVKRVADRLERATRRAVEMLEGLLAFAKEGRPAQTSAADVGVELKHVLEELAPLADDLGATLDVEVSPKAATVCSPPLLHVVLLNLLSNAIKFLDGRERRWVGFTARVERGVCVMEVADSGPGIPRALRERIFEPFFRAPGASAPGTGIGLATVQRIVTAHGGTIVLESVEGEGTRVRVQLPAPATPPSVATIPAATSELRH